MNIITVDQAADSILNNQILAVPTETVYGLFGLANSQIAVNNVYAIKNRPSDNPLICHFHSLAQILEYVQAPPEYIYKLIELLGPASLTYVLELKPNSVLAPACVGLKTVCCRIPNNPIALALLQKINIPLFGPSANTSTRLSGVNPQMIDQDLGDKIAGIIDGGQCQVGLESTIIDTLEIGKIKILRPGVIGWCELRNWLVQLGFNDIEIVENQKSQSTTPGAKYRHYSPKTKIDLENRNVIARYEATQENDKLVTVSQLNKRIKPKHPLIYIGLQEFKGDKNDFVSLGSKDDLTQVSADFYFNLYQLDQQNIESCVFDRQTYQFIRDSKLSIAKALFNRLEKALS